MREPSPLREGECFGAAAGIDVCGVQPLVCLLFGAGEACAEAVAELFAALRKAGADDAEEVGRRDAGDGGLGEEVETQYRAVDFGTGEEGAGGHALQDARSGVELDAHSEERHLAGLGNDALRDFSLHEEDGQRGRSGALQDVAENGAGDVVGKIGDDLVARAARRVWARLEGFGCIALQDLGWIEFENVGVYEGDVGLFGELLPKDWNEPPVELDGCDAAGACGQLMGQSAEAGADFEDIIGWREIGCVGDAGEVGGVDEEVLAEGLSEVQVVAAEQFER